MVALLWLHVVVAIFAMLFWAMQRLYNACTRRATLMDIMIVRTWFGERKRIRRRKEMMLRIDVKLWFWRRVVIRIGLVEERD